MPITRQEIMEQLEIYTLDELATFLGLSRAAVAKWPADHPIPPCYHWQLWGMFDGAIPKPSIHDKRVPVPKKPVSGG